jgi:dTDP-4-dehydrorhamnose reductase
MARVLLIGANGQVGFELLSHLAPLGEVIATTRSGELPGAIACEALDLAQPGSAAELIDRVRPACIVNAAAYTAVDRAEDEPAAAQRGNADALAEIGAAAHACGALVVHYSTDYVFPGDGTRPYREDDATAPQSVYGRTKLDGERLLAQSGADHLIFRTAWVYGARGHNFLRTMLRLARERDRLAVVDDQRGAPTPASLIAAVTAQTVGQCLRAAPERRQAFGGVHHLASGGETSWHGFATAIFERAVAAGLLARAPTVDAIASGAFPAKAKRPAYSVLDTTRLRQTFGVHLPSWQSGLDRVMADMASRPAVP